MELIPFLGTVCLQFGVDVVRQIAFALPIAFAWDFEKAAVWHGIDDTGAAEVAVLITGLAAGSISVLAWPHEHIVGFPIAAMAAMASPLVTGAFLHKTGVMFRQLGKRSPSLFAVRDATIFALGISLMRVAMLAYGSG